MVELQRRESKVESEVSWGDRIATLIMLLLSASAVIAFTGAALELPYANADVVVLETWRALGFLVFAGLFLLLALKPRHYPGIWELVFLHKGGMALAGIVLLGDDAVGARAVVLFDGVLALLIVAAYILSRGYSSWVRVWRTSADHRRSNAAPEIVTKRPIVRGGQANHR